MFLNYGLILAQFQPCLLNRAHVLVLMANPIINWYNIISIGLGTFTVVKVSIWHRYQEKKRYQPYLNLVEVKITPQCFHPANLMLYPKIRSPASLLVFYLLSLSLSILMCITFCVCFSLTLFSLIHVFCLSIVYFNHLVPSSFQSSCGPLYRICSPPPS